MPGTNVKVNRKYYDDLNAWTWVDLESVLKSEERKAEDCTDTTSSVVSCLTAIAHCKPEWVAQTVAISESIVRLSQNLIKAHAEALANRIRLKKEHDQLLNMLDTALSRKRRLAVQMERARRELGQPLGLWKRFLAGIQRFFERP